MVNLLTKEIYFSLRFGGWNLDSDDSVRLASSEARMEEGITVAGRMEKRSHGELGSQKSGGTRPLATHPNGSGQGGGLAVYPEWASSSRVLLPEPQRAGITAECHHGQRRLPLFVRTNCNPIKGTFIPSDDGTSHGFIASPFFSNVLPPLNIVTLENELKTQEPTCKLQQCSLIH